jgi:hypothetical protein
MECFNKQHHLMHAIVSADGEMYEYMAGHHPTALVSSWIFENTQAFFPIELK